jgi:hypothetical protein
VEVPGLFSYFFQRKKKQSLRSVFQFLVPQVSKVRFTLAPWMLSLHPWWVLKLFFIVYSLKRFHPEGSSFGFS